MAKQSTSCLLKKKKSIRKREYLLTNRAEVTSLVWVTADLKRPLVFSAVLHGQLNVFRESDRSFKSFILKFYLHPAPPVQHG